MNQSPLAVVHPEAKIGQNVTIDPFAVIEKDVVIGDNCHIYSHAVILDGARIGDNCSIFPGAVIAGIPQDLKFKGEQTTAEIGKNTTIRECVTINRGTASQIAGEVEIDDFAIVSGGSLVHQFTRISKHVMVQGGSRIGKDIPPYTLIGRDPIVYCGINIVGLRRRGFTNQQVFLIQDIYRTLYTRGLNNTEAIKAIETEYEASEERDLILNFIKTSERGIVRGSIDE